MHEASKIGLMSRAKSILFVAGAGSSDSSIFGAADSEAVESKSSTLIRVTRENLARHSRPLAGIGSERCDVKSEVRNPKSETREIPLRSHRFGASRPGCEADFDLRNSGFFGNSGIRISEFGFNRSTRVGCWTREPRNGSPPSSRCHSGGGCCDRRCRYRDHRWLPVPGFGRGI